MSNQNLILKPSLFERYHCAILSAEQNQGIGHFSLDQVKQFLDIEANEWGDICHRLTSFWGISIVLSMDSKSIVDYLLTTEW